MEKVAFCTLGCKVNQVETEHMIEEFTRRGYQVVEFGDPADIYVVNTCTVTHISDRKSRAVLRRAMRSNPRALVVATGCATQVAREQFAALGGIGLFVGNQDKEHLVDMVESHLARIGRRSSTLEITDRPTESGPSRLFPPPHRRTRAFIKIQDGCQSCCSYCIVPRARGPLRSQHPDQVMAEFTRMLTSGYREIVLTGIHTGMYGIDLPGWDLTRLLGYLLSCGHDDYRIRLSSIEPLEWHDGLLELIAGERKICRHFHIPLQSGSDRILESMRRRYSRDDYRQLLHRIAASLPESAFTADVMVGYPSETDEDFQATFELLSELPIYELHVFKYSRRAGTPAASMEPQVTAEVKQRRSDELLKLSRTRKNTTLQHQIGRELEVLVERRLQPDQYLGLSDNYIQVVFPADTDLTGELVRIRVLRAGPDHVDGVVIPI